MSKAFFAGSFDPMTNGHLDVLHSALNVFPKLVIGIGTSASKVPLFSFDEREKMIIDAVAISHKDRLSDIEVIAFSGLLVDVAKEFGANIIVRGLRDSTDFDYEMQMAGMNGVMDNEIQTVFMPSAPDVRHITATLVRQISKMGGDVSSFVPPNVNEALKAL